MIAIRKQIWQESGQQLDAGQMPSNTDNNYLAIERIVGNCTDNTVSLIHKTDAILPKMI